SNSGLFVSFRLFIASLTLTFPFILEEIQRTSCQPREVCVEVAKEYPESTSQFYLPRCVALHRCGGCCTNEAFYCTNTSHTLVNKTVSIEAGLLVMQFLALELFNNTPRLECAPFCAPAPQTDEQQQITCDVHNTLLCRCSPPDLPCASGSFWDPVNCVCVSTDTINYSDRETGKCA
uniref:Platelet-derived growth factor (PDGF) family profile domain-containing protein n=1 Tax=Amphiprion ocellaris TaxID=80972 RepID=A0AAQ5Z4M7_AMPOC